MVSAKLSELDSSKSFEQAVNRLGWFNTYARQVLLCRYMLRQLSSLNPDDDWMGPNHESQMLLALRLAITVLSGVNRTKRIYSAPYTPSNRPETHYLKFYRSDPIFELSFASGAPEFAFHDGAGSGLGFDHGDTDVFEDRLFSHEVLEVGKGVSLSNKEIADQRSIALSKMPLWRDFQSSEMSANIETLELYERESPRVWRFWLEWYTSLVNGVRMDRDILNRVALIPDEDWDQGPKHIAQCIEDIRANYLAEKTPVAETVEFDDDKGKFHATPLLFEKPDLIGATLSQVQDAIEDVLATPANGLHDNSLEIRKLRRTFERYGNDPQQIEMGFVSVQKGLTRQLLSDELPASEENLALRDALEEGARAIRATHPVVAENRKILNEQAIRELPEGAKEQLEEALPILVAISDENLADDWQYDIPQLINDATTPLPSGASPLPGADETTRIFSRAAKMSLLMKSAKIVHAIDNGAAYKATAIALLLKELVTLGLKLL
ncbi:hypothetical protein [Shimia sediminis]|uniref:hypothetical protein n=1 Tax=Shimia sediminis TaxID=2497945 RepID=UPI000F8E4E1B|nr:hypothetical protein [Shimia sediminis]